MQDRPAADLKAVGFVCLFFNTKVQLKDSSAVLKDQLRKDTEHSKNISR